MACAARASELSSDINITPMIDILLALLIIFMAIAPIPPSGLEALVPRSRPHSAEQSAVVLEIMRTSAGQLRYRINTTEVRKAELAARLKTIFSHRSDKTMFVKADKGLEFAPVANSIDIAKGVGVDHVGLITLGANP
jgi:biopolymer transport protein ExbD